MKQTAVEWLVEQIKDYDFTDLKTNEYFIFKIPFYSFKEKMEQAKEMEKEQMIKFSEFVASYPDKNKNIHGDMLHAKSKYDGSERTIDLLEQFYNETFKK